MTSSSPPTDRLEHQIAVVGLAGRFPAAPDVDAFWHNLREGVEAVSFFSDRELDAAGVDPELRKNPSFVAAGAIVEGLEEFDAGFFGFSPREAEVMDPQHRIFLETAWQALEDAACDPSRHQGLIGVFAGSSINTYLLRNVLSRPDVMTRMGPFQVGLLSDKDFLATRTSYKLDLRGPSVSVQTACSTSLVAVHFACQSLLSEECDLALAGGVSAQVPQTSGYLFQEGGVASPDGHCRAFDHRAKGAVSGQGVGVVVLKRLRDALADGDRIRAVVRGSAINNDGAAKVGYTAPSVEGQAEVIVEALALSDVPADSVGYIEAHGTGTELGDPIEIEALTQAFRESTDQVGFCHIGSVKTNIGHLDAAAGIAGMIKAVLGLEHGEIPPSLHYEEPNPRIDFESGPFRVADRLRPWPETGGPRRAGVSSFGIGGTNAHVVLEQAPAVSSTPARHDRHLVLLSARNEDAVEAAVDGLAAHLAAAPDSEIADVAYTSQLGRRAFEHRRALVARSTEEAAAVLAGRTPGRLLQGVHEGSPSSVSFLFPGLGDHYPGMGCDLYRAEEEFRRQVDRCAELLEPLLGEDVREVAFEGGADPGAGGAGPDLRRMLGRGGSGAEADEEGRLDSTLRVHAAVFTVEYALARLFESWGVRPASMIGYSLGELVAACVAGVFPLESALALVVERARLVERVAPGAMTAVPLAREALEPRLGEGLWLAAVNAPQVCVVAGLPEAVGSLERELSGEGVASRRLLVRHAFHSGMMEPIADELAAVVERLSPRAPEIPYLSNLTGTWITADQARDPESWARHLCEPVLLADSLGALWSEDDPAILVVGPGQSLGSFAATHPKAASRRRVVIGGLRGRHDADPDRGVALEALGRLWTAGAEVDWAALHDGERRLRVALPAYPFQRRRYWIEPGSDTSASPSASDGARLPPEEWFHAPSWRLVPRVRGAAGDRSESAWADLGPWLLVGGGASARALEAELRARGATVVAAEEDEDWSALRRSLTERDLAPGKIVHLASLAAPPDPGPAQESTFFGLLALAQAFAGRPRSAGLEIVVATRGLAAVEREDELRPERATVRGPALVIPQEYPGVRCRIVDLDPDAAMGDPHAVRRLADELASEPPGAVVALRGDRRWVESFEPVVLTASSEPPAGLRRGGVFLVTGGLGGIGIALARHLFRTVGARLVLLGRTPLPEREQWGEALAEGGDDELGRKLSAVRELEAEGAEVLLARGDVTSAEDLERIAAEVAERFGPVHGIFHLAAIPGAGLIQLKDREAAHEVLAPKLQGTAVLHETFASPELDLFVLFSSLSAVAGGVGQADYCAANAFLGALAERRAQERDAGRAEPGGTRWVAVDWCEWRWDRWTGRFFGLDSEVQEALARGRERYGLSFDEGMDALDRVLASELPRVLVSTRDLAGSLAGQHDLASALEDLEALAARGDGHHPRPDLPTPYQEAGNALEETLVGYWEELIGVSPIGVHDDFFQLGGHSLLGTQLFARLSERFGVELPLRLLFDVPTVARMAVAVEEALVEALEELPEDEAESMALAAEEAE